MNSAHWHKIIRRRELLRRAAAAAAFAAMPFASGASVAALPSREQGSRNSRVLVIGAGLAGLSAALELTRAGHQVTVLEARSRPGGRVFTAREPFSDGLHSELGAVVFSGSYREANRYIDAFGLTRRPFLSPDLPALFHVAGVRRAISAGDSLQGLYDLRPEEQSLGPIGLVIEYVIKTLPPGATDADSWPGDALRKLDKISFADYLRQQGASEGAIKLISDALYFGWDPENASTLSISMTDIGLFFGGDPMFVLEGGNDRLPKAMAAALGDRIRYGVEVVGLRQSGEDVRLRARVAGAEEVFDAEHVVVALPAPVASRLEIAGGPPAMVSSALAALPQHDILRVQFQVDSAFCRAEPNSGAATTDLFGGRVDRQPYDTVGEPGRPSVLDALIVGEDAGRMAQHSDTELLAEVATQLEKIHPGFGAHRGAHAIQRWVTDPYTLGGWSWPAPGFVSDHLAALQLPYGRLHFAGEHTDLFRATMEGALRSGLRAASQIEQITAAQA